MRRAQRSPLPRVSAPATRFQALSPLGSTTFVLPEALVLGTLAPALVTAWRGPLPEPPGCPRRTGVRPALHADGYNPAGHTFVLHRRGFKVTLRFRKSKFSTPHAVEYAVDAHVVSAETVSLFDRANREAKVAGKVRERPPVGQWESSLGRLAGHQAYWTRLRADDDLEAHAQWLLKEIRHHLYLAIERELDKTPVPPTPLDARQFAPTQHELEEEHLRFVLQRAREMGAQVSP